MIMLDTDVILLIGRYSLDNYNYHDTYDFMWKMTNNKSESLLNFRCFFLKALNVKCWGDRIWQWQYSGQTAKKHRHHFYENPGKNLISNISGQLGQKKSMLKNKMSGRLFVQKKISTPFKTPTKNSKKYNHSNQSPSQNLKKDIIEPTTRTFG